MRGITIRKVILGQRAHEESCFVPANIPIQIGMLLAPPTVRLAMRRDA